MDLSIGGHLNVHCTVTMSLFFAEVKYCGLIWVKVIFELGVVVNDSGIGLSMPMAP